MDLRLRQSSALLQQVLLASLSIERSGQVAIELLKVFKHDAALLIILEAEGRMSVLSIGKFVREGDGSLGGFPASVLEHTLLIFLLLWHPSIPRAEWLGESTSVEDVLAEDIGTPRCVYHVVADVCGRLGWLELLLLIDRAVSACLPQELLSVVGQVG